MTDVFHEYRLDDGAFMRAVQNAADLEYEYVLRMVGQEGILQDIAQRDMARQAVRILQGAGVEMLADYEFSSPDRTEPAIAYASDIASREYVAHIAEEMDSIDGFHLIHIDARRFIVDQVVRIGPHRLQTISLEASYYPTGILVTKDLYDGFSRPASEPEPMPVEPDDFATLDQFIKKISRLR